MTMVARFDPTDAEVAFAQLSAKLCLLDCRQRLRHKAVGDIAGVLRCERLAETQSRHVFDLAKRIAARNQERMK